MINCSCDFHDLLAWQVDYAAQDGQAEAMVNARNVLQLYEFQHLAEACSHFQPTHIIIMYYLGTCKLLVFSVGRVGEFSHPASNFS